MIPAPQPLDGLSLVSCMAVWPSPLSCSYNVFTWPHKGTCFNGMWRWWQLFRLQQRRQLQLHQRLHQPGTLLRRHVRFNASDRPQLLQLHQHQQLLSLHRLKRWTHFRANHGHHKRCQQYRLVRPLSSCHCLNRSRLPLPTSVSDPHHRRI